MGEMRVACSADSVIVIEVRWHCFICRLSKVEPRNISVFAIRKDGFFSFKKGGEPNGFKNENGTWGGWPPA